MAKQTGEYKIEGVIDGVCFYKVGAEYYARMHQPIQAKRFWKDNAFEGSRRSCRRLALGSRLASRVYKRLPDAKRSYAMFCQLKSAAIALLKQGVDEDTVSCRLELLIQPLPPVTKRKRKERSRIVLNRHQRQKKRIKTSPCSSPNVFRITEPSKMKVTGKRGHLISGMIRFP